MQIVYKFIQSKPYRKAFCTNTFISLLAIQGMLPTLAFYDDRDCFEMSV